MVHRIYSAPFETTKKMQYAKKSNNQCYKSKSQSRLRVAFIYSESSEFWKDFA